MSQNQSCLNQSTVSNGINNTHSKSSASLGVIKIPKLDFSKLKTNPNNAHPIVVAKSSIHHKKSNSFIDDTDD
jgi:hypothetical protein